MTPIEEQALVVARAWRRFSDIDRRLAEDRRTRERDGPRRAAEERDEDMRNLRPAYSSYQTAIEVLAKLVL